MLSSAIKALTPAEAVQRVRDRYSRPSEIRRPLPSAKARYAEYLKSTAWHERAKLVHARARGMCEGCGKARSTEVHHLTYKHVRHEFLFELVALCGDCHDRWHGIEA